MRVQENTENHDHLPELLYICDYAVLSSLWLLNIGDCSSIFLFNAFKVLTVKNKYV